MKLKLRIFLILKSFLCVLHCIQCYYIWAFSYMYTQVHWADFPHKPGPAFLCAPFPTPLCSPRQLCFYFLFLYTCMVLWIYIKAGKHRLSEYGYLQLHPFYCTGHSIFLHSGWKISLYIYFTFSLLFFCCHFRGESTCSHLPKSKLRKADLTGRTRVKVGQPGWQVVQGCSGTGGITNIQRDDKCLRWWTW